MQTLPSPRTPILAGPSTLGTIKLSLEVDDGADYIRTEICDQCTEFCMTIIFTFDLLQL